MITQPSAAFFGPLGRWTRRPGVKEQSEMSRPTSRRRWHARGRTCCWRRPKPSAGPGKHYRIGAGPACRPSADHRFAGPKTCCRRRGAACSPGSEDLDLRQPGAGPRRTTVQRWPNERSATLIPLRQPRNARHRAPPFRGCQESLTWRGSRTCNGFAGVTGSQVREAHTWDRAIEETEGAHHDRA